MNVNVYEGICCLKDTELREEHTYQIRNNLIKRRWITLGMANIPWKKCRELYSSSRTSKKNMRNQQSVRHKQIHVIMEHESSLLPPQKYAIAYYSQITKTINI